jgi:hypothetical protein
MRSPFHLCGTPDVQALRHTYPGLYVWSGKRPCTFLLHPGVLQQHTVEGAGDEVSVLATVQRHPMLIMDLTYWSLHSVGNRHGTWKVEVSISRYARLCQAGSEACNQDERCLA